MYKAIYFFSFFWLIVFSACAQGVERSGPRCQDPAFNQEVQQSLQYTVPPISCEDLSANINNYIILDAREIEEFNVSHIPNAQHIGYKKFKPESLAHIEKDQRIIVYCSIGYRSEKIGEKIQEMGYSKVYNLYGSIFEWVNQGNPVVNLEGELTPNVHTYNKKWSKWVLNPKMKKVY